MTVENEPLLSVRNLHTYFAQDEGMVKAVDGVSLEMSAGATLGVVGESGCGKSVTARSILRIVDRPGRIVAGEIWFRRPTANGGAGSPAVDLAKLEPNSKEMRSIRGAEIALIFQEPMSSFSPVHSVGNQIIEAIVLHEEIDRRGARAKAIEMLRRVGVSSPDQRIDQLANQLSGGLRQRAMIAMALSCSPTLLIADEPTTALDVTTQTQILELLRQLQQEDGMAIMLITHDLGVIAEMATDVAVMYLGRVVEQAPVDAIFHAPKHPYTRALLRSIPRMRARSRERLTPIAGSVPHPYDRPEGCPFHPRCPDFMPGTCDRQTPELRAVGDRHTVSCFLYP
ncbi:MAG: dipeptide/oligopeptide/nickel ABC transporter ATP-binding protein [Candidatus Rokuibacteriota bacterium]|nr:MAG: dipeptide/oligopeptide/nickel ABC transporter ATP-binding protein [Candidatus Rokubacteria bacterium]PYO07033.1 MAG: dipeptide/oligopeptide/nickel ABC transporter ATP-binding protein [Candidatus Rokubacteria bacterium]